MHLFHNQNKFQKNGKPIALADTVTPNLPKEQWKDIQEFEGLYQLSNHGRVRSLSRFVYIVKPGLEPPGKAGLLSFGLQPMQETKSHQLTLWTFKCNFTKMEYVINFRLPDMYIIYL